MHKMTQLISINLSNEELKNKKTHNTNPKIGFQKVDFENFKQKKE